MSVPIVFENLHKQYGDFVAVDDLNLEIQKNSFTGLLGPNGAGKSTSLKILTNLIHPTSGRAYLNGHDVAEDPKTALEGVGTVVETPEFYPYLTPRETFRYVGEILGMTRENIAAETEAILAEVKMSDWADKKLGTFSKGMRQRISLGLSFLNDPNIIVLDEPTSGLDPRGMAEMRDILRDIRRGHNNLTVLMSSHMMHEVSDLCDYVALIDHGRLKAHESLQSFILGADVRSIIVSLVGGPTDESIAAIKGLPNVVDATPFNGNIRVRFRGSRDDQVELFGRLAQMGLGVFGMADSGNALEERYLGMIQDSR